MAKRKDVAKIREALRGNRLYVKTETGFQREITARCPDDGGPATVQTMYTERGELAPEITGVKFRCIVCGNVFLAKPEDMVLR